MQTTFGRGLGVVGLLLMMVATFLPVQGVAAQDEEEPAGGDCVAALGIGNTGDACVSVVHASPDAPLVDIYVDGEHVLGGLGFGWWSKWLAVPAGKHRIQVTAAGAALDTAVIDATLTLDEGVGYQVAATGFLAEIKGEVYETDFSPIAEGRARVQVVHTVPDAPAVDVAVADGDVLVSGLEFPNASDFLEVPAGSYDLEVQLSETGEVVLPLPGVELDANTLYQIYAIGTVKTGLYPFVIPTHFASSYTAPDEAAAVPDDAAAAPDEAAATPDEAAAVPDDATVAPDEAAATPDQAAIAAVGCTAVLDIGNAGDACVNVVHASPDAPLVDVYIDGALAFEALEFYGYTGWVPLPAGDHQVQVTATGEPIDTAVIDATLTLDEGVAYHIVAAGLLAEIEAQTYQVDLGPLDAETARVGIIHVSPEAPAVDVAVAGGDVLVENLAFPDDSGYLEVPAGTYDLEVRPTGTEDVVIDLSGTELEGGTVYDVFAMTLLEDDSLDVLVIPSVAATADD